MPTEHQVRHLREVHDALRTGFILGKLFADPKAVTLEELQSIDLSLLEGMNQILRRR